MFGTLGNETVFSDEASSLLETCSTTDVYTFPVGGPQTFAAGSEY